MNILLNYIAIIFFSVCSVAFTEKGQISDVISNVPKVEGQLSKEEAVDYLVMTYPEAQLSDLYKSFYQDNFGPGHLLGDLSAARRYFNSELADTSAWGGPVYEYTGEGKNFVRLNMDLIRQGIIPADEYFLAFQNSLGRVEKPSDEYWISTWNQIDSIVKAKGYAFINEPEDRVIIEEKIESKNFPIHHSDRYNDAYNFHYRIISLPEFQNLKVKYLENL